LSRGVLLGMRDDALCEHATSVYFQLVDAVAGDEGFG
jgi:hypothetical protein